MKIVKRDGHIVEYDSDKIRIAIGKANNEVRGKEKATKEEIEEIIRYIEELNKKRILVEDIQDIIEEKLMEFGKYQLAKKYITYRYTRELVRKANTTDQTIKELIEGENEYWNNENSNKNAAVVTTQRDYLAGITSTDITRRFLLPEEIVKAHDEGIIHFHDADYFAQNALHNCELINLDDMLQNGTNINGVMIEKPHRFITAATIATQIILAVTSSSYGGATISLSHLAPFVRDSYNKYYKKYKDRKLKEEDCKKFAMEDTKKEVSDGVQTFNYQVNSMTNTNGLSHGTDVWLGNAQDLINNGTVTLKEAICCRDDIMVYLMKKGVPPDKAFKIMETVRKGKALKDPAKWEEFKAIMKEYDVPDWYIKSCEKIKYMFPKAHAAAYVTNAFRIAWFKVHMPLAYYAAYYSIRAKAFDAEFMINGRQKVINKMKEIESLGNSATQKDKEMYDDLEIVNEMYLRGIEFLPIDLYKSHSTKFLVEDGKLRPPFNSIAGLGGVAAESIYQARCEEPFECIEDMQARSKIGKSVTELLEKFGCLKGMTKSNQMSLFV